ncbi:hypothetical protein [Bacillus sp. AFS053548]|uniref:hypothetical protein n=1 Tax=Bacillus sp. AFS053548 TaxID=2033505 RepID=UPI000BFB2212|nr:hypothetical protein [Bacillus sp. AFS053548]PGM58300.1 hypothetical protein CN946_06045 [Bacillus sp. AFS053548]
MIPTGLEPATPTLSITEYEYNSVFMNILVQLSPVNQAVDEILFIVILLFLLFLISLCNFCAIIK